MTSPVGPALGRDGAAAGRPDAAGFNRLVRVATTGSTNADLAGELALPGSDRRWPHLSVLVAEHQAAGRGRAGRSWQTPPGAALTASVVLRPGVPLERWAWLSLLGGLAVARAIDRLSGLEVALKWPNDVLLLQVGDDSVPGWGTDRKVAGVLAEVVRAPGGPAARAAVLGFGVNVHQRPADLPVPWATSLTAAGAAEPARDLHALLCGIGEELRPLLGAWAAVGGDAQRSGLAAAVRGACATLGREVTVTLPGEGVLTGRADGIDDDGALLVRAGGRALRVTVGDVGHVRAAGR